MKRSLLIALALILTFSLAACGGNNSTPSGSSNISNSANTPSASSGDSNIANSTNTLSESTTNRSDKVLSQMLEDGADGINFLDLIEDDAIKLFGVPDSRESGSVRADGNYATEILDYYSKYEIQLVINRYLPDKSDPGRVVSFGVWQQGIPVMGIEVGDKYDSAKGHLAALGFDVHIDRTSEVMEYADINETPVAWYGKTNFQGIEVVVWFDKNGTITSLFIMIEPDNPDGVANGNSNDFITSDNPTFTGDSLQLFGLEFDDAGSLLGKGFYSGDGPAFGHGKVSTLFRKEIVNDDASVFVKLKNSMNSPQRFVVREVYLKDNSNISFCGIKIGDTLIDAEQRLTNASDRIQGGIIGYIEEMDGTILQIFIGDLSFLDKADVKQHLMTVSDRTISWTVEIDGTIYEVNLTTSDNKTIDSIVASSYDNEEIELGVIVPFMEVELNNSFSIPSKPVGVEGLDPQYWD